LAGVYFAAAKLGLSLGFVEQVSAVWPPTGIALAAVLVFGYRVWPGITLGAFLANATANEPLAAACSIAVGNTLEALVGAWLLRRLLAFRNDLDRLKDTLGLTILAGGLSTTVSATIGVTSLCLWSVQPWSVYGSLWWVWWLGDAMGALVVAPLLLTWVAGRQPWPPRRRAEALILLAGLVATCWIVFTGRLTTGFGDSSLAYSIFPFVIWAALRFGQQGTTAVTLVASSLAVWGTVHGLGPFATGPPHERLLLLQVFTAVIAVTGLLLAAALTERRRDEQRTAVLHAVTRILAESATLAEAAPRIVQAIGSSLAWPLGAIWQVDPEARKLRCVEVWHGGPARFHEFEAVLRQRTFEPGVGLPGRVWASGQPAWIPDVVHDANFPRAPIAAREGLHGALSFPIRLGEEVLGVIEFFCTETRQPDEDLLRMMASAGSQIGQFIERKRAEEAQALLAAIVESSGDAIIGKTLNAVIVSWNAGAERMYGYSAAEMLGQSISRLLPSGGVDELPRILNRLRAGQRVEPFETVRVRKDGRHIHVSLSISPIKSASGAIIGAATIARDISAQKRAEQTARFLADASAALASLVDYESTLQKVALLAVPFFADWCAVDLVVAGGSLRRLAVAHVDPAKVALAHELARRYAPDPEAPRGAANVLRTGRPEWLSDIPDALLAEAARDEEHLRILRELGLKSYICVPLSARGKTLGALTFVAAESGRHYDDKDLAVAEDLAYRAAVAIENAQLYRELREGDRRKDEFLALLAHELRNPLAPIRNGVEIMKMIGLGDPQLQQLRDMLERQVLHMSRLVDDLLDVSRITRGKITLRKEPMDLAAVVARAVETSRPLIDARRHELAVTLPPEPLRVQADPTRLAQVFANLLNNAAKYTQEGGRIGLTAARTGTEVEVRVRDSGIGIAPEMLPRVFDLFAQADQSLEHSDGGLGIGLTLVRTLVEMHGGTVQAFSEGPARGSEFVVRLPLLAEPLLGGQARAGTREERQAASARRVLVVDDNQDTALSLGLLLQLQGHEVFAAHDGPGALQAAQDYRPDAVLLDIGLPGMDGYEVARRIRLLPELERVLLVAMTGYGQEEDKRRSQAAGFNAHLVKPADLDALKVLLTRPEGPRGPSGCS
jgi:PAS domain S-box-containing protein